MTKELLQITASTLDKLKVSNPALFVAATLLMIGSILVLDNVPYFAENYSEVFTGLKYGLISVSGLSSSSTFKHLKDDHPKKIAAKVDIK